MRIAIMRPVSPSISRCELTHVKRQPIDLELARTQHHSYEDTLRIHGCRVEALPIEPDLPDSVFVEDCAVVLDECAIIARPGAEPRRAETTSVANALAAYRALHRLESPATLDGGDVLCVGRRVFVGRSNRTNAAGMEQLATILDPYHYEVIPIEFRYCLHLKSAATLLPRNTLLINPAWVEVRQFQAMEVLDIDPSEPSAANVLTIGDTVLFQSAYPRTQRRLHAAGFHLVTVDMSELAKAEGALTCCSLIFSDQGMTSDD